MTISSTTAVAAASAQAQSTASLVAQSTLYAASVGGKTYPADVNFASGEYVATVPQLPGISATGSTLLSAENNLNTRISVLV